MVPGHGTGEAGISPCFVSPAKAVRILNVEPGGYWPIVARLPPASAAGVCAMARIPPVDGRIATIMACWPATGSSAISAARWMR